jgi:hypothetical protein
LLLAKARRLPFWNDHQMVADFTGRPPRHLDRDARGHATAFHGVNMKGLRFEEDTLTGVVSEFNRAVSLTESCTKR